MTESEHVCRLRGHNSAIMIWIKILFPLCMSDLCINFQIPASNTVGGVRVTQTVLQCDTVKIYITFRGHYSAIMSWIKILFPLCICSMHV